MLSIFKKKKSFLSQDDAEKVLAAIQAAEKRTSGEIRVFIESRNPLVNPLERAAEQFQRLNMLETAERNGVLIYLATEDRELALFADEGIHKKMGTAYWNEQVQEILQYFKKGAWSEGLLHCIHNIGEVLAKEFPYKGGEDRNELSDEIVFGK
jgi:uncharacterized membrane protein